MARANQLEAEGESIIHFEVGQPDFVTPKYIRDAACVSLQAGNTRYTSNYGNLALRKGDFRQAGEGKSYFADPESEIMVTVGGEEAMAAAVLALVDAGDEVLLTDPGIPLTTAWSKSPMGFQSMYLWTRAAISILICKNWKAR